MKNLLLFLILSLYKNNCAKNELAQLTLRINELAMRHK